MINTVHSWNIPTEPYIEEKNDKWEYCPVPLQDETFLSWFVRLSKENCSDPRLLYIQLKKVPYLRNNNLDFIGKKLGSIQNNLKTQKEILSAIKPFIKESIHDFQTSQYKKDNPKDISEFLNVPLKYPRYCPYCLEQDEIPYFRESWYFKPFLVCPLHQCLLIDTCPHCNTPIQFWNTSWKSDITSCSECGQSIFTGVIGTFKIQNLDYYALIEQVFIEFEKYHKNTNKSLFFQHLWKNISHYNKDPQIKQANQNDMLISRENLFRAILVELKYMIEKPNRRKSIIINKNGMIEHIFTIEDLEEYGGNLPNGYNNDVINKRLNAITPLLKIQKRTYEDVTKQAKYTGISSKTLYNWMKRYREDGIEGLIPKHHKSGRKQKAYLPEIKALFELCIENYISKPNLPPIVECWNRFNDEAAIRGFSPSQLPKRVTFYSMYTRKLKRKSKIQQNSLS